MEGLHRAMKSGVLEITENWGKVGVRRRGRGRGRMLWEQGPILEPQGIDDESDSKGM